MEEIGNKKMILGGYFNAIINNSDKRGGIIIKANRTMQDFQSFIEDNELYDVVPRNGFFTWNNRRIGFTNIRIGFTNIVERADHFILFFWGGVGGITRLRMI